MARSPIPALGLQYTVETGNSRAFGKRMMPEANRLSHGPSINFAVRSAPAQAAGWTFGTSYYRGRLNPPGGGHFLPTIWTAYAVYRRHGVEWLNEVSLMPSRDEVMGRVSTPGFYIQAAYRLDSGTTPHARFESINARGAGEMWRLTPDWLDEKKVYLGGLRFDIGEVVALKTEVRRSTYTRRWRPEDAAILQLAFAF